MNILRTESTMQLPRLLPVFLTATLTAQQLPTLYPARSLDAEAVRSDLTLLRRALDHVHPGLHRYTKPKQLDAAFASVETLARGGTDDVQLYRAISVACAVIRCGHTRVMAPRIDAFRNENATQLPFTFRIFDEKMWIDRVAPGASGLQRGDRVVAIAGRAVDGLIREIAATVCIDGFTDAIRASRLDTAYEFDDSGFDHYLPAWIGFRSEFPLRIQRGEELRECTVKAISRKAWRALRPRVRDFHEATSVRMLDAKTALLRVDTFVNYRKPIDATARYRELFREIGASKCAHLIVDLRKNGGGSNDAFWPLARFLVSKSFVPGLPPRVRNIRCEPALAKHLSTWERDVWTRPESMFTKVDEGWEFRPEVLGDRKLTPHADRFRGRVTVLTSPYNASGSTMLVAWLQKLGVPLVGEPTGGAARGPTAGLLFTLTLPSSRLRINIPAVRVRTGLDEFAEGKGVEPDVRVNPGVADFLNDRDAVLEAARRR